MKHRMKIITFVSTVKFEVCKEALPYENNPPQFRCRIFKQKSSYGGKHQRKKWYFFHL